MKKDNPQITWNPNNLFSGTAWYYARYRPGYSHELFRLLYEKFSLNRSSRVLDLGCGTGQIALPMAPYVGEVIAVDPQEEMLAEARSQAATAGIKNISWLSGESGNLPGMAAVIGKVNLTVIARAFHWMDKEKTLEDLYALTRPGGGVAVVSDSDPPDSPELPWKAVVSQTVRRWLGEERKAGTEGTYSHPAIRFEEFLKASSFKGLETTEIHLERNWSIDQITGYLYSTSYASVPVLGDKRAPLEAEIRMHLQELEPSGVFTEQVTIQVMMVWKPIIKRQI
jgi:ubiquinone/menaquinone biosynthesis C-methylase UbiE